jgi:hypothetical protein
LFPGLGNPVVALERRTTMNERWRCAVVAALGLTVMAVGCGSDGGDRGSLPSLPNPPITVAQLVARSADTPITVAGFLHVDEGQARLCDAILESYPPQCGAPSVMLVGVNVDELDGTTTAGGITWLEGAVFDVRRIDADVFEVIDGDD